MKIDNKTKKKIRKMAECLPVYYETFHQRKHIHHKDIVSKNLETKDYDAERQYQASFFDGKRLIDANAHYKRMCNAYKKGGEKEYRKYIIKLGNKNFQELSLFDKLKNWLNNN